MPTAFELRDHADARLFAGDYPAALHAYRLLVQAQPNDLDVRLRLADTLLAMGEVQAAAVVYTTLARHAANGGYPLRALVCVKILEALEPELGKLVNALAEIYGKGSPRLGRGVRLSLADAMVPFPDDLDLTPPSLPELLPAAAQAAVDLSQIAAYPPQVSPIPLFSELPPEAFARVLAALKLVRKRPGDVLLHQGEEGTSFFVLARGSVEILRLDGDGKQQQLAKLHDGAIFGEMALVSALPRSATVRALDDCDLLEFDRDALQAAADEVVTVAAALDKFTRERLLSNLLQTSPLFAPLERKQRYDLLRRFKAIDVTAGTSLITEGQPGEGLFLLLSGEVDVWKTDGDEKVLLATLGAGDVFGEISLVNEEPTTASVSAGVNSTVLFLSKELFAKLVGAVDGIRDYVENLSDERLMDQQLTLSADNYEDLNEDSLVLI